MGELNRKLWSLGEFIEDVENAQGGSYSAALFWEPSQTSEAVEERLSRSRGSFLHEHHCHTRFTSCIFLHSLTRIYVSRIGTPKSLRVAQVINGTWFCELSLPIKRGRSRESSTPSNSHPPLFSGQAIFELLTLPATFWNCTQQPLKLHQLTVSRISKLRQLFELPSLGCSGPCHSDKIL
jgi:hypothetical protein